jgi:hypothetical protein
MLERAMRDELEAVHFLDLNHAVVQDELAREAQLQRSGPTAEAVLKRLGAAGARVAG